MFYISVWWFLWLHVVRWLIINDGINNMKMCLIIKLLTGLAWCVANVCVCSTLFFCVLWRGNYYAVRFKLWYKPSITRGRLVIVCKTAPGAFGTWNKTQRLVFSSSTWENPKSSIQMGIFSGFARGLQLHIQNMKY